MEGAQEVAADEDVVRGGSSGEVDGLRHGLSIVGAKRVKPTQ
jgi:hypothetical protein